MFFGLLICQVHHLAIFDEQLFKLWQVHVSVEASLVELGGSPVKTKMHVHVSAEASSIELCGSLVGCSSSLV